jgi:hypothetical protein
MAKINEASNIRVLFVDWKLSILVLMKFFVDVLSNDWPCLYHPMNIWQIIPILWVYLICFHDLLILYPHGLKHRLYLTHPNLIYSLNNSLFLDIIILLSVKNHHSLPDSIKIIWDILLDTRYRLNRNYNSHQHLLNYHTNIFVDY